MDSHELPDNCKQELLVSIKDILGTDADKLYSKCFACIESDITVNAHLKHVVWILFNTFPINHFVINFVNNF